VLGPSPLKAGGSARGQTVPETIFTNFSSVQALLLRETCRFALRLAWCSPRLVPCHLTGDSNKPGQRLLATSEPWREPGQERRVR
jgi:hypothetical protein